MAVSTCDEIQKLQLYLDRELSPKGSVRMLEAGCGSASYIDFGEKAQLVGIDISQKQLERNNMLHEKILGDIQRFDLPLESFDVIICWDVLEHLTQPDLAIANFSRAIKPRGLIVLKLPNVLSLKGLVTKFVPHNIHVLAYRYFYGDKNAGKDDSVPFKTYLRFHCSASSIQKQGVRLGLTSDYVATFDVAQMNWLRQKRAVHFLYSTLKKAIGMLSLGRIGDSELIIVMRRRLEPPT